MPNAITSPELRRLLESATTARIVDVRTSAEFETAYIAGSYNVPLDVLDKHGAEVAQRLRSLKWVAAGIGAGLTYAAISNTCAMANLLSKLPYNRGTTSDATSVLSRLGAGSSA